MKKYFLIFCIICSAGVNMLLPEPVMAKNNKEAEIEEIELTVFAAASLTETLTEISELYKKEHPNVEFIFNFDSSGTLKTQIQEGAKCDLFLSAGKKQMDQLDITASPEINTESLDCILEDTRTDLLENKVTLCVAEGLDIEITCFDDLAEALKAGDILMAMGNSDVPVGQYTQKILEYYGLDEKELASMGVISYGTNAKEVMIQVSEGSVDCGILYCTDAYAAGLEVTDYATAEMCGQVVYPAAVLNISEHPDMTKDFLDFLKTDASTAIFERVGFLKITEE